MTIENRTTGMFGPGWKIGMLLFACMSGPAAQALEPEPTNSAVAAAAFSERIDTLIDALPVEREAFEVRINRCADPQGGMRNDVYAVWVGARLVAMEPHHASDVIFAEARRWRKLGWDITRERKLPNGGANLAASDPQTGDSYSLDSGFAPDPERYVVGYFSTRCLVEPSGAAPFGPLDVDQAASMRP